MALTNPWDKTKNWSHFEEEKTLREKEEEEEKKKRREEERKIKQKGMETDLDYGFYEIWHGSFVLYDYYLASNLWFVRISSIIKDVLKLGLVKL